jgi:hypothetical protein
MVQLYTNRECYLVYNNIANKVKIVFKDNLQYIRFRADLAKVLGFKSKSKYTVFSERGGVITAPLIPDVDRDFDTIFCYSNLVSERMVGDVMAQLLRTIPVPNNKKATDKYFIEFKNVHYVSVGNVNSDIVEVLLTGDDGEPVPFVDSKVVATVHFRKRAQNNI